jgi:predicted ribosome quality control (RQC) complex YloA/Tae2 family protein
MYTYRHWFNGINEYVVFHIGCNAYENFEVIDLAQGNPKNLWFHVENNASNHCVAIVPDGVDKKELRHIIKHGAVLCKSYSRFKSMRDIPIVYTTIGNITKTRYVGMVNTQNTKTISI